MERLQTEIISDDSKALGFSKKGLASLGNDYMRGLWECDDLYATLQLILNRRKTPLTFSYVLNCFRYFFEEIFTNPQSVARAAMVADGHYNLRGDLFRAMLDSSMSYTCGYWKEASSLEGAQRDKLRVWCEKLDLKPGMRVLDIGCGWGNFAQFAAKEYGVHVTGVTISNKQAEFARRLCVGLPVEILLQDYRSIQGQFDRVISIEMIEAVGKKNIAHYFGVVERSLKSDGLFGLQAISAELLTLDSRRAVNDLFLWIRNNIFPNGYVPRLSELTKPSPKLSLLTLESLAPDYAKTLLAWHANLKERWHTLGRLNQPHFRRMWDFYLLSCAALFNTGNCDVYQIIYGRFSK
jgi:cyclopropane-fatty-acyl-phospholipid synthase